MSRRKQQKEIDKAIRNLMKFVEQQPTWRERLDELYDSMIEQSAADLKIEKGELIGELGEAGMLHMVEGYLFEEFATTHWDGEERSFIDEYLKRRGWRETPAGRRYLQAMSRSDIQLWEITRIEPGEHVDIRPYGTEDPAIRVIEKSATQSLHQWDCIAARVIKMDNRFLFTGGILPLPPTEASKVETVIHNAQTKTEKRLRALVKDNELEMDIEEVIQESRETALNQLPDILFRVWAAHVYRAITRAMPTLLNRDGESFQPATVRFPTTGSTEEIGQSLDDLAVLSRDGEKLTWTWFPSDPDQLEEGDSVNVLGHIHLKEKALELETNSRERAEKGGQLLSAHLGELVGQPITVHENLSDKLENGSPLNNGAEPQHSEAESMAIQQYLDQHYQNTLDEPIPMLDDKSPRECASDPRLQGMVLEWLKTLENQSSHSPMPDYDFSWIWKELGLDKHRS